MINFKCTKVTKLLSCISLLIFANIAHAEQVTWQSLKPGLEYASIPIGENNLKGQLHAFKINLNKYQLHLATASAISRNAATAQTLGEKHNALVAINGGFFSPDRQLLGLRVDNGDIINPVRPISWWSVFYVKNNKAYITRAKYYHHSNSVSFAVQAGPRLVINGRIPSLKPGLDERSAICINRNGQVIIAATENTPISTQTLAQTLDASEKDGGLGCYNALNLDGGSSSQLYASIDKFTLNVPNFNQVTDAIIVTKDKT